jgi:hypothetical protein
VPKAPKPTYEHDGAKLGRVVEVAKLDRVVKAAMLRGREAGKQDLAAAVKAGLPGRVARLQAEDATGSHSRPDDNLAFAANVPKPTHEYEGAKLQRVIEAAMRRAREPGKYDLAAAVKQVHQDGLLDSMLRMLLEANSRPDNDLSSLVKAPKTSYEYDSAKLECVV